jgi:hypothetical protein
MRFSFSNLKPALFVGASGSGGPSQLDLFNTLVQFLPTRSAVTWLDAGAGIVEGCANRAPEGGLQIWAGSAMDRLRREVSSFAGLTQLLWSASSVGTAGVCVVLGRGSGGFLHL